MNTALSMQVQACRAIGELCTHPAARRVISKYSVIKPVLVLTLSDNSELRLVVSKVHCFYYFHFKVYEVLTWLSLVLAVGSPCSR